MLPPLQVNKKSAYTLEEIDHDANQGALKDNYFAEKFLLGKTLRKLLISSPVERILSFNFYSWDFLYIVAPHWLRDFYFELSSTRIGFSQSICIIFIKGKTKDCLIPLFLTPGALKQTIQISYVNFFFNQGCYKIESLHEHFQTICSQNLTPDDCLAFLVDISITNIDSWQHFKT